MGISLKRLATSAMGIELRARQASLLVLLGRAHVDESQFFAGVQQLLHPFGGKIVDGVFDSMAGKRDARAE